MSEGLEKKSSEKIIPQKEEQVEQVAKKTVEKKEATTNGATESLKALESSPADDLIEVKKEVEKEKSADKDYIDGMFEDKENIKEDEIPNGKEKDAYLWLKERVGENPVGVEAGILALAKLWAIYAPMFNNVGSANYLKTLDEDEDYKDLKFNKKELKNIMVESRSVNVKNLDKSKIPDSASSEEASTKYICDIMGFEPTDSSKELAAKLKHSETTYKKSPFKYETKDIGSYRASGMVEGTILVFSKESFSATNLVAIATGNGDEFKYYDSKSGKVEFLHLFDSNPKNNGISISPLNCHGIFVPTHKDIKPKKFVPSKKKNLDKISADYSEISLKIFKGKTILKQYYKSDGEFDTSKNALLKAAFPEAFFTNIKTLVAKEKDKLKNSPDEAKLKDLGILSTMLDDLQKKVQALSKTK